MGGFHYFLERPIYSSRPIDVVLMEDILHQLEHRPCLQGFKIFQASQVFSLTWFWQDMYQIEIQ